MATTDWNPILRGEFDKPYWRDLQQFVDRRAPAPHGVPAASRRVRRAPPHAVRRHAGADPRPGSVPRAAVRRTACASRCRPAWRSRPRSPTSIASWPTTSASPCPSHGNLEAWARQGVLLLNATLTVRAGQAGLAPGQGVGDVHRRGDRRRQRQARARRVRAVGQLRPQEAGADRRPAARTRSSSRRTRRRCRPTTASSAATVQPRQRRARRPRPTTDRLGALMGWPNDPRLRPIRRRSRLADFVLDVLDAYGRHRTGRNASLLAYMGLLTVFPLLLVATTILGLVLESNPDLQDAILDSFVSKIPVVGATILDNQGQLTGSWVALVVGLLAALWGSLRAFVALQTALDDIWEVEHRPPQLLRATPQQPDLHRRDRRRPGRLGGARRRRRACRPAADEPVPADVRRLGAQHRRGRIDLPLHDVAPDDVADGVARHGVHQRALHGAAVRRHQHPHPADGRRDRGVRHVRGVDRARLLDQHPRSDRAARRRGQRRRATPAPSHWPTAPIAPPSWHSRSVASGDSIASVRVRHAATGRRALADPRAVRRRRRCARTASRARARHRARLPRGDLRRGRHDRRSHVSTARRPPRRGARRARRRGEQRAGRVPASRRHDRRRHAGMGLRIRRRAGAHARSSQATGHVARRRQF